MLVIFHWGNDVLLRRRNSVNIFQNSNLSFKLFYIRSSFSSVHSASLNPAAEVDSLSLLVICMNFLYGLKCINSECVYLL